MTWPKTAICKHCGKEFEYWYRKDPKYCSKMCSVTHEGHKRLINRVKAFCDEGLSITYIAKRLRIPKDRAEKLVIELKESEVEHNA